MNNKIKYFLAPALLISVTAFASTDRCLILPEAKTFRSQNGQIVYTLETFKKENSICQKKTYLASSFPEDIGTSRVSCADDQGIEEKHADPSIKDYSFWKCEKIKDEYAVVYYSVPSLDEYKNGGVRQIFLYSVDPATHKMTETYQFQTFKTHDPSNVGGIIPGYPEWTRVYSEL